MPRVALVLAFDGTAFSGWQAQPGAARRTVQGCVEEALATLCGGGRVVVEGAGRTDAGAHALGMVAHADVPRVPARLAHRLDRILPDDVGVRAAAVVSEDFHARKSARGKRYEYRLHVGPSADPLQRHCRLHVPGAFDLDVAREAAALLVGEHDFAAFQTAGSSVTTTRRHVRRCAIEGEAPDLRVAVEGSGFLRHMVRAMAGSLLDVARGHRDVAWLRDVLASRSRARAGANAPARALVLCEVFYDEPWASMLKDAESGA